MSVPKKTINEILNSRVVDKEKYISEDINYLKDIINKKADVIDMMSPGPLRDELRGTFDPTQETYEEYLQRQAIQQIDRPLTGQLPSDAILETQRIDLNEGGVIGPGGMFRGEDLGTREGFKGLREELRNNPEKLEKFKQDVASNSRIGIRKMYGKKGVPLSESILARILKEFNIKKFGKLAPRGLDKIKPEVTKNANKILEILKKNPTISMNDLFRKSKLTENQFTSAGYALKTNRVIDNKPRFDIPKNIADKVKKLGVITTVEDDLIQKNILKPKEIKTLFTDPRKAVSKFFIKGTMFEHTFPKTLIPYIKGKTNRDLLEITGTRTSPFLNYFKKRYDNLQRGAVNKFLQDGDLKDYNKTINSIRDIVRKATGGYEIGYIKFDKNKNPTPVINAKPVTEGFKQFGVQTNQRMSAFKNAQYSSTLLKNYFKNPNSEIFNSLRKDFPVESIPKETVKNLDIAAKSYNKAKPFLGNISKFITFAKNNLANPLVKALFKTSYGKAALVTGALLSPNMLAASEPGSETPEETAGVGTMLTGAGVTGAGYLGGKKLIEKTTGRFAPMIKGAIGKVFQSPFALPFRATGLDRLAMKKLGLLPEDETLAQTYDPRTASGRTALGLEATAASAYRPIAKNLTSGIKDVAKKSLARRILSLGPTANILARVGRVTTPLGIASLLGEGAYQLLVKPQREYLESLDPEERKTVEQQYADVAAAEGGIIRKAYKDAGLVEKLGRGAAAFDPRNLPYYGAKALKGLGSGVEMAIKFPVAAGAAIGESLQQKPTMETLRKFGEAMQPSATQYLSEKTGLESLIKGQEKELLEKRPGAVTMGDVLELGAEFVAPATGYIKMIEDGGSKLYKILRNSQKGKKVDSKDIDEVLEVLSDKGVGRRDFMAVVGGTSALALAKHIGLVDAVKILEKTKPVRMLGKSASKMPEWFPNFASRILDDTDSVFKQIDEDVVEITNKNLPDVSISKHSSGRWEIQGYNEYGQPYLIDYEPPAILEGGIKYPGDFSVFDSVPSRMGPDDVEFDSELVESMDDVLGGTSKLEEWTTGVKKKDLTPGEKRVVEAEGRAESEYDAWRESEWDE